MVRVFVLCCVLACYVDCGWWFVIERGRKGGWEHTLPLCGQNVARVGLFVLPCVWLFVGVR